MQFHSNKPIYLQISDYICEQILTKQYQAKERIPSVRETAVNLEVNPNTVMRTYAFLESQDIISMQRGVGYFITEQAYVNAIKLKREEFINTDLPKLAKTLDLLNLTFNDLKQLFKETQNHETE